MPTVTWRWCLAISGLGSSGQQPRLASRSARSATHQTQTLSEDDLDAGSKRRLRTPLYRELHKPNKCAAELRSFENRRVLPHSSNMCRVVVRVFGSRTSRHASPVQPKPITGPRSKRNRRDCRRSPLTTPHPAEQQQLPVQPNKEPGRWPGSKNRDTCRD